MSQVKINGRTATHYCNQCGALWIDFHTHWSLASLHCGKCCDNVPMGEQIVPLPQPTTPPAVEGDGLERFLISNLLAYVTVDGDDVFAHWKGVRRSVKDMATEYLGSKK